MRLAKNKVVTFEPFFHEYTTNEGKFLMGVTTLLHKHNIGPDLSSIPAKVLEDAAERGTAIHNLIEDYINGRTVVEDDNLKAFKKLEMDVHCTEYLVSDNTTIASSIDLVCSDCSLADIKTWASVDAERKKYVTWQLSIYAYLFELQNKSKKVPHIYLVHVRDGKAKMTELNRIPSEKVEQLIRAEMEGRLFVDESEVPNTSGFIAEEEALSLVSSLDLIAQYKAVLKAEEEKVASLQERIYNHMVENNLDEILCGTGKFVRRAESTRTSVDTTRLKKEMPEIYEKFLKTTQVKGSISFKSI